MKPRLYLLMAVLLVGVAGVSGAVLLDNGANTTTGWITLDGRTSTTFAADTVFYDSAPGSLKITDSGVGSGLYRREGLFFTQNSTSGSLINATFYVAVSSATNYNEWGLRRKTYPISSDTYAQDAYVTLYTESGNFKTFDGPTTNYVLRPITASTWYKVSIVYTMKNATHANDTFDLYINDVLEADDYTYRFNNFGVDMVAFQATGSSSTGSAWIDSIYIADNSTPPSPGNTTYVSLTAIDAYDGTAINTFNGTAFLGSNFTYNDTSEIWVFDEEVDYYHFTPAVADPVTVATPAGCVLPSTLRKDGGDFDCQGSFGTWVKVRYFGESAVGVQGLYNQGSYSTTNGTIVTTIDEDIQVNGTTPSGGVVADAYVLFEVEAENYYDNNSATFLANTGTTEASLAQGFVYFTCYELYTEDGLGCESGDSPLPRKAGSYTDQINVTDYFSVEYSYNVTALTTVFHDVYGFFDYNLTVSANDYAGNPEANFSINLYNENLSLNQSDNAMGSSITYSLLSAYTYEVVLNATSTIYGDPVNQIGYANISIVGTPPASESYQFNLSAARPVFVTLYYEENVTLFENPANLSLIPLSDSSEVFITETTSNGTANFYNIPVAEYRLRVSSPGYHDEDRYFILSTYTGQNLTAYFRENTTGTEKEFNVVDERNILQNGWIIRFQRYYNDTGWITVDEARSNIDGLAVENLLSDEYYRLILLNEGLVEEYRSERTLLLQDTYQISSDVDTITNTQINKVLGVSGLVYMYPNLNRVEAIGTSSSGTRDWKLELYRTYTDGPVLINSTTASGDSVNLSLYLPNSTGRYYAVLSIMGSEIQTAANSIFIGGGPAAIGSSGAFYSFVLLLGIVGLAVFSAPAAIVLSIFALAVASMTGLFYVGLNAIVGLAIVGGMIIFRRNT